MIKYRSTFNDVIGHNIVVFLTVFRLLKLVWVLYLDWLQFDLTKRTNAAPPELAKSYPPMKFKMSQRWTMEILRVHAYNNIFLTSVKLLNIHSPIFSWLWNLTLHITTAESVRTCAFVFLLSFIKQMLSLPFEMYVRLVLAKKFQSRRKRFQVKIMEYLTDRTTQIAVGASMQMLVGLFCTAVVQFCGKQFHIYLLTTSVLMEFFMVFIYVDFLAPMFSRFYELPKSQLKTEIEKVSSKVKFPADKIFILEASEWTSGSNAFFLGFFQYKRIVLYDNIVRGHVNKGILSFLFGPPKFFTVREIVAIICHEIGHWKKNHLLYQIIFYQCCLHLQLLFSAFLIECPFVYSIFGFKWERPTIIGLIATLHILSEPIDVALMFLHRQVRRCHEREADIFVTDLGYGEPFCSSMVKFSGGSFPVIEPLVEMYYFTHPSTLNRIRTVRQHMECLARWRRDNC